MKRPMVITLIMLFIINLSITPVVGPIIPDPGPSVSPGNICCDGCGSLSIPVKNIKDTVFSGQIEIKIADPNDNIISQDSISITLAPGEERVIKTPICPPCSSFRSQYGTYQITATVIEDSGKIHDRKNTYFVVQNCPSTPKCSAGPTETYQCMDNKVKRLYKNADCTEYWEIIKDCDQCNDPPCKCAVGSCIHVPNDNGGENGGSDQCNPEECQGTIGGPYLKNGKIYQRYKECNCDGNKCECGRIEKEVPCTGTISGHVYEARTGAPINSATLKINQNKYFPCITNAEGFFSVEGSCPSELTTLVCSAEGYSSDTKIKTTDKYGNLEEYFELYSKMDIEIISNGYEKYNTKEPVFFRENSINLELSTKPKSDFTYELIYSKTGDVKGDEVRSSEKSVSMRIPEDIPIGKYYIKIKETGDKTKDFYIIFNPNSGSISQDYLEKYWADDHTGQFAIYSKQIAGKNNPTNHFTNHILDFAMSAAEGTDLEYLAIDRMVSKLLENTKPSNYPWEDIGSLNPETLIADIQEGKTPIVNCDSSSYALIALFRSIGIPCRSIYGVPNKLNPTSHVWIEVWIPQENRFVICDSIFLTTGTDYCTSIGSAYLNQVLEKAGWENKPIEWDWINDETGIDRKKDYYLN